MPSVCVVENDKQWERNFPDGCAGLVLNLGNTCLTDNGSVAMELEKSISFDIDEIFKNPVHYFNQFYTNRINEGNPLQSVINDIHLSNGQLSIYDLSKSNYRTVRQLERNFKKYIGISPKAYSNIIRFQKALNLLKNLEEKRSLLDIAFECGFYDHSHLTNEIKKNTGFSPSEL
ncbi:helix-turn-helix transcriptional regulator [Galbibacter orientalis]|uniref:helix-turn-helix domain-containing protein n=1 Tax=Galbibacter orientalis TaxID=453852 RepID=UPI003080AB95